MNLVFEWCDYGDDFEAICNPPEDWMALDPDDELEMFIWFKAYDVGMFECDRDEQLASEDYCYDCLAWVEFGWMSKREYLLKNTPARTREEAERILQATADAIYETSGTSYWS